MGGSKRTTIGYRYYMGMHMVICHGPVDEVEAIIVADREAWTGSVTSNQTIFVDSPDLFGGEKKEGGIQGNVDIALGGSTQGQNAYLQGQLGNDIPAFRGVTSLILNQVYLTAMTRYPKPWSIQVKRAAARSWYPATAEIVGAGNIPGGSANGAHIIYEALTNADWGLGLPAGTLIDDTAFRAAADTLFAENFGLSMIFARQGPVEGFIQNVLSHIGAVLYSDRTSGRFVLKLIRPPSASDVTNALDVNESNIVRLLSFERPSFAEMINEVVVVYRRQGNTKDSSLTLQDLSSTLAQNGIVSQTLQFPGIDNPEIAARIGQRELRQFSTPLARVRITIDRSGWDIVPGDIVKFSWPDYGIANIIIRVFSVDYGNLVNGAITIEGTEDIYSLPSASYIQQQDTQWADPVVAAVPVPLTLLNELPYYEIATNFSPSEQDAFDNNTALLQVLAATPTSASASYQLWLSPTTTIADYEFDIDGNYTPSVIITSALARPNNTTPQTIVWISSHGILPVVGAGIYGYINSEIVLIQSFDVVAKTITIKRGLFDTIPQAHAAGSRIFFAEGFNVQATPEYMGDPVTNTGDQVFTRILVQTDINTLDINSAPEEDITFVGRQAKPYSPGQVQIESQFFPERLNALLGVDLNWVHRDRITQLNPTQASWFDTGTGSPETGVSYTVRIRGETSNLISTNTGITGTTFDYTSAQELIDSGLTINVPNPNRVLITSITALATSNVAYNQIITVPNKSVRWMTNDFATVDVFLDTHFINGTTGVKTFGDGDLIAWRTLNTVQPHSIKAGVTFITTSEAGTQPSWAIEGTDAASQTAVDTTIFNIDDYRAVADEQIQAVTREHSLGFFAEGSSARKVIHYFDIGLHVFTQTDLTTPTVQSTRNTIESYFTAEDSLLDVAGVSVTSVPSLESPYAGLSTNSARPPWRVTAVGQMVYVIYRGSGGTTYNTSSKFLNILNILDSHITISSTNRLRTSRNTISGTTISNVSTIDEVVLVGRSNVADNEAIEWDVSSTDFRIINSTTGATNSTVSYTSNIKAMTVDWVTSRIYIVRSDNQIYQLDYSASEIANVSPPAGIPSPDIALFLVDLKVSQNFLYLFDRTGQRSFSIAKDLTGGWSETILGGQTELLFDFDAQVRADSSLIIANDTLYDENGGTSSATPQAEPRQNTSLTVEVTAVRAGIESFQPFSYTLQRTGYGYNYGNFYGE